MWVWLFFLSENKQSPCSCSLLTLAALGYSTIVTLQSSLVGEIFQNAALAESQESPKRSHREGLRGFELFYNLSKGGFFSQGPDTGLLGPKGVVKGNDADVQKKSNFFKSGWGQKWDGDESVYVELWPRSKMSHSLASHCPFQAGTVHCTIDASKKKKVIFKQITGLISGSRVGSLLYTSYRNNAGLRAT